VGVLLCGGSCITLALLLTAVCFQVNFLMQYVWRLYVMDMWLEAHTCLIFCQVSLLAMAKTLHAPQVVWLLTSPWTSTTTRSPPSNMLPPLKTVSPKCSS
jgi:hypothetical protein